MQSSIDDSVEVDTRSKLLTLSTCIRRAAESEIPGGGSVDG